MPHQLSPNTPTSPTFHFKQKENIYSFFQTKWRDSYEAIPVWVDLRQDRLEQQLSHCCRLGREQKSFATAIYLDWMTLAANLT